MKQTLILATGLPTMSLHRLFAEAYGCCLKLLVYLLSIAEMYGSARSEKHVLVALTSQPLNVGPPKLVRHPKKINRQHMYGLKSLPIVTKFLLEVTTEGRNFTNQCRDFSIVREYYANAGGL